MTESEVQKQILDGLRALGAVIDVTHDARHRPATPGVPDIIAALPNGRTLWVECKGENGRVSEEQLSFIARLRANGHTALVACGWDDLERFI
ncbi:MAG TPA: VRR-NUC domain-containing protein [Sedimentisphaerales bacterium]|nr:VRR-NUC domain-containing protein [Sedimentisphaerales bacterium]